MPTREQKHAAYGIGLRVTRHLSLRCGGVAGLLRVGRWYLHARRDEMRGAIGGESSAIPTVEYLA